MDTDYLTHALIDGQPDRVDSPVGRQLLVAHGEHRSAGPVDLLVAAVAELSGVAQLHCDRDFEAPARHTGQPTVMLAERHRS